ncbi:hypothetical protein AcW1_009869 [Taiwanofungus camphoratus]|nr:hypothetical protein AcW1_009869 [Antrodia cinnamomea]
MGELDSTYGAVLIGVFVSAILFGVTNLQVFVYFKQCSHDILWNKFAVCWLWCLDSVHLTLCFHMVYWYLITNYADPDALFHVIWSFKAQIILDAIVVVSVHTLYTIRVWKLDAIVHRPSRFRRLSPLLVSFLMLSEYGAAIGQRINPASFVILMRHCSALL